jgi:hypothetical protein
MLSVSSQARVLGAKGLLLETICAFLKDFELLLVVRFIRSDTADLDVVGDPRTWSVVMRLKLFDAVLVFSTLQHFCFAYVVVSRAS